METSDHYKTGRNRKAIRVGSLNQNKMKKLIFSLLAVTINVFTTNAQITLEQSYADIQGLSIIKLENSEYKYLQYDLANQIIKLYNLNHSLFKTITLPNLQPSSQKISIAYISENLFNLDNFV